MTEVRPVERWLSAAVASSAPAAVMGTGGWLIRRSLGLGHRCSTVVARGWDDTPEVATVLATMIGWTQHPLARHGGTEPTLADLG